MKSESTNPQWADTPQWLPEKAGRWSLSSTIGVLADTCSHSLTYLSLVSEGTSCVCSRSDGGDLAAHSVNIDGVRFSVKKRDPLAAFPFSATHLQRRVLGPLASHPKPRFDP